MLNQTKIFIDDYLNALEKIKTKISESQYKFITTRHVEKSILYWNIGVVLLEYNQWGSKIVESLSVDLTIEYTNIKGFSVRNLNYMKRFAARIPTEYILYQVGAKIGWKGITLLLDKTGSLEEHLWYTQQCIDNNWSSSVLSREIENKLYARQTSSKKSTNFKKHLIEPLGEQAEGIIKEPYIFDFVPTAKKLKEVELEKVLVEHITKSLSELGPSFAFIKNQYCIKVGCKRYFIDLLLYNVILRCYFVVELKTVEFQPEFAGKLQFYLALIDKEFKTQHINPSIGLLLCRGKEKKVVEYTLKDISRPMVVSNYIIS